MAKQLFESNVVSEARMRDLAELPLSLTCWGVRPGQSNVISRSWILGRMIRRPVGCDAQMRAEKKRLEVE